MRYVTLEELAQIVPEFPINDKSAVAMVDQACDDIDALCYGRIRKNCFSKLTKFQQDRIKKAVCYHAVFLCTYGDMLSSPLTSYGINGVSMSFSTERTVTQGGVTTTNTVMTQLRQSGLASRLIP